MTDELYKLMCDTYLHVRRQARQPKEVVLTPAQIAKIRKPVSWRKVIYWADQSTTLKFNLNVKNTNQQSTGLR